VEGGDVVSSVAHTVAYRACLLYDNSIVLFRISPFRRPPGLASRLVVGLVFLTGFSSYAPAFRKTGRKRTVLAAAPVRVFRFPAGRVIVDVAVRFVLGRIVFLSCRTGWVQTVAARGFPTRQCNT